jgi:hypothetical protein
MKIAESAVNLTEKYRLYDDIVTDIEDTIFDADSPTLIGDIYRASLKEHGRCTGKVYVERWHENDGKPMHVGWTFQKRVKYDDSNDTFLMETWVTLLDEDYTKHFRTYHRIGDA